MSGAPLRMSDLLSPHRTIQGHIFAHTLQLQEGHSQVPNLY